MTDAALIAYLRTELPALIRQAVRAELAAHSRLSAGERDVVEALGAVFGAGSLKTKEILAATELQLGHRPALRLALDHLVGNLHHQRIGLALRKIVKRGGVAAEWRLQAAGTDRGGRLWVLERTARG